jgi:hypothetical protein
MLKNYSFVKYGIPLAGNAFFFVGRESILSTLGQQANAMFAAGIRLMEACFVRGYDYRVVKSKGRQECCNDLPAAETVYHHAFDYDPFVGHAK